MADPGRPKAELVLTDDERETLARWARRRRRVSQQLALRSRIVLELSVGGFRSQGGAATGGRAADRGQVAVAIRRATARRFGRRAEAGRTALDR